MTIFILWMHRSWTSLMWWILHTLWLRSGKRMLWGWQSNPKWHFENLPILKVNNNYLKLQWSSRNDPSYQPTHSWLLSTRWKRNITYWLNKEFTWWVSFLKDPRLCILREKYQTILHTTQKPYKQLVVVRNPYQVINSHKKRDDMPPILWGLLWIKYNLHILHAIKWNHSHMVTYDQITSNPTDVVNTIRTQFGLHTIHPIHAEIYKKIDSFVDPWLNRSKTTVNWIEQIEEKLQLSSMYDRIASSIQEDPTWDSIDDETLQYYTWIFEKALDAYSKAPVWEHNWKKWLRRKLRIIKDILIYYKLKFF